LICAAVVTSIPAHAHANSVYKLGLFVTIFTVGCGGSRAAIDTYWVAVWVKCGAVGANPSRVANTNSVYLARVLNAIRAVAGAGSGAPDTFYIAYGATTGSSKPCAAYADSVD
jgi:hypothetical protein